MQNAAAAAHPHRKELAGNRLAFGHVSRTRSPIVLRDTDIACVQIGRFSGRPAHCKGALNARQPANFGDNRSTDRRFGFIGLPIAVP